MAVRSPGGVAKLFSVELTPTAGQALMRPAWLGRHWSGVVCARQHGLAILATGLAVFLIAISV